MNKFSAVISLCDAEKNNKTGIKAKNLSRALSAGFKVLPGFVIPAHIYSSHLWSAGLQLSSSNWKEAEDREQIRQKILSTPINEEIRDFIISEYNSLGLLCGKENPNVVVRSSAIESKDGISSFPGAYESFLNVSGANALLAAVKRVWASLWSGKAAAYRIKHNIESQPEMAVIVQCMIDTEFSGTVQTAYPISFDPGIAFIKMVINPQIHGMISEKRKAVCSVNLRNFSIIESKEFPMPAYCDDVVKMSAEAALMIEEFFGKPVYVEWAYDGNMLWIFQADAIEEQYHFESSVYSVIPSEGEWKKLTTKPVSIFSRDILSKSCKSVTSKGLLGKPLLTLCKGYLYERTPAIGEKIPSEKRVLALAEEAIDKWDRIFYPEANELSHQLLKKDFSSVENFEIFALLKQAVDSISEGWGWFAFAEDCVNRLPIIFEQVILDCRLETSYSKELLKGIYDPFVIRDAMLLDMAYELKAAKESDKIDDAVWWTEYKNKVYSFACDWGYAFCDLNELFDPSSFISWTEDLDSIYYIIAGMTNQIKTPSLLAMHTDAEEKYREATSFALEKLTYSEKNRFQRALQISRSWIRRRSECEAVLGKLCSGVRMLMMEIGNRLNAKKILNCASDIFYLRYSEILEEDIEGKNFFCGEIAKLVAERKHDLWIENRYSVPDKFTENNYDNISNDSVITCLPCSIGKVSGKIRIVRNPKEASEVKNGDIVVAPAQTSAWLHLLLSASGIIFSRGFLFSNMSILAREYGIPIISDCGKIDGIVKNGDIVFLDGGAGILKVTRR
ncbi:MAG: PEP/pyruvate-binding domain-containing protein [Armatimonadota bacterium]